MKTLSTPLALCTLMEAYTAARPALLAPAARSPKPVPQQLPATVCILSLR